MIGLQGHLTVWVVRWVSRVINKELFKHQVLKNKSIFNKDIAKKVYFTLKKQSAC